MITSAHDVARILGGHPSGTGFLVRCPVPGHGQGRGDRTPSLSVADGDKRLLVRCFAGCDASEILDIHRRRGLATRPADGGRRPPTEVARAVPDPKAVAIWQSAQPVDGTLADRYLHLHRGIARPFPSSLRFAPSAFHLPSGLGTPALVAEVRAPDGKITAVQMTFLTKEGAKAILPLPRRTHGLLGEGAFRSGPAGPVLGIAEGVEDALAASQVSQLSCWACLGAGRMHRVHIPDVVRELHIFADDDEPGQRAAERTALRHGVLGRRVIVRLPPAGFKDWGEVASRSRLDRSAA